MKDDLGKHVRSGPPETEKFDMNRPYIKQKNYARPFIWAIGNIQKWIHLGSIKKVNMEGIKPPYILLCNHNAFFDFYIMSAAIAPHRGIFPAAVDDYIARERELRKLGTIPKRKYTADISILRNCRQVLKEGMIFGIYAEARYSLCGETEVIPDAIAQLCKYSKVPVVTFMCQGHHLYDPFWGNNHKRWVKHIKGTMTCAYRPEELKTASLEEINEKIHKLLYNDDFRWQSENRVKVTYKKRAEGLHKVLYQCPHCMTEYKMNSENDTVFCEHCGKKWKLNIYGELEAQNGETEFKFPTDWYKWEREQVKKEVQAGTYKLDCDCYVNDLPNSKGYVRLGSGRFLHDMTGFHVEGKRDYDGEPFKMDIDAAGQYAVHVEYDYRFGGFKDCVDLNTLDDTWYVFPTGCDFSLTKISLATEEIFNEIWRRRKEEKEKAKAEE